MITYFSVTHYANLASADILIEPNNQHYAVDYHNKNFTFFYTCKINVSEISWHVQFKPR